MYSLTLAKRFFSKVLYSAPGGCWEWSAGRFQQGYGMFYIEGKTVKAHRISWELHYGSIGDKHVCHRCDNPPCINPAHLFIGTHTDNVRDRNKKNRHNLPKGSTHWKSKLTEEQVKEIKGLRRAGISQSNVAKRYNVGRETIKNIDDGSCWAHVKLED